MGASQSRGKVSAEQRKVLNINDRFPDGIVYEAYGDNEKVEISELLRGKPVNVSELLAGKKTILLGIPGAFTPNCTQYHLPGYVAKAQAFLDAGADQILCFAANDVFVCKHWSDFLGATGRVRLLADPRAEIARKAGLALDLTNTLGRTVFKRFSAIIEDGVVKLLLIEGDGLGLQCTMAVPLLSEFSTQKYRRLYQP